MVEQSVLDVNLRGLRTDPPFTSRRSLHAARAWIPRCNWRMTLVHSHKRF